MYSINFLGGSQTFLGTLATIIILFIVIDSNNESSNLIQHLLKEVREKVEEQIKSLVRGPKKKITDGIHYDDINRRLEAGIENKELENEASSLLAEIKSKQDAMLLKKGAPAEYYDKEKTENIVHAKELSFAPLYSFSLCIIVFLYDELLRSYTFKWNDLLLTSLACFISFSFIIWLWMWVRNIYRVKGVILGNQAWQDKRLCKILHFKDTRPSYMWLVELMSVTFLISLIVAILINSIDAFVFNICQPYTSAKYFKIAIFSFLLINGILFPFFVPYMEYHYYLDWAKSKNEEDQNESDNFEQEYTAKLNDIFEKLRDSNSN